MGGKLPFVLLHEYITIYIIRFDVQTDKNGGYARRPNKAKGNNAEIDPHHPTKVDKKLDYANHVRDNDHGKDGVANDAERLKKGNGTTEQLRIDGNNGAADPNRRKHGGKDDGRLIGRRL